MPRRPVLRHDPPSTTVDVLARMTEAEDTLRAIGEGEVDAFVVAHGDDVPRVFTLADADRPYRMFVENMRDGAATVSRAGLVLYANRRLAELLSSTRDLIVGAPLALFAADGMALDVELLRGPDGHGATFEHELLNADGAVVPVLVSTAPLNVEGDQLTCITFTDLSAQRIQEREITRLNVEQAERMADLQQAQAALTRQATHDGLTGLPNRALLVGLVDQALGQAARTGMCTVVLFVDLDRFKHVNDTHGHAAGDAVLRTVARRLVSVMRPKDTVARIGGDEFVILAPDVDSRVHAVDLSQRLIDALARRSDGPEDGEAITGSIGVAVSIGGRGTAETLLEEADQAMYKAKSRGGGRAEVFDAALGREVRRRSVAQQKLHAALEERRVIAHFQPVVGLAAGRIVGFEALARIVEADDTILAPAAFIAVAEDSGLIVPLGEQVLEQACQAAGDWQPAAATSRAPTVAVNLSPRQLESGTLLPVVSAALAVSGLAPERLLLELTETAIMDLRPDVLSQLRDVRELGVEIGLDDFGTGYASLTHLRRLPLTFVKVDQSFVKRIRTDRGDARIVAAVVDLARNLGLRSIAEGVETHKQLARLRELGCDEAQGYLFARPFPAADVDAALGDFHW